MFISSHLCFSHFSNIFFSYLLAYLLFLHLLTLLLLLFFLLFITSHLPLSFPHIRVFSIIKTHHISFLLRLVSFNLIPSHLIMVSYLFSVHLFMCHLILHFPHFTNIFSTFLSHYFASHPIWCLITSHLLSSHISSLSFQLFSSYHISYCLIRSHHICLCLISSNHITSHLPLSAPLMSSR